MKVAGFSSSVEYGMEWSALGSILTTVIDAASGLREQTHLIGAVVGGSKGEKEKGTG
jgi:hypothetical protein